MARSLDARTDQALRAAKAIDAARRWELPGYARKIALLARRDHLPDSLLESVAKQFAVPVNDFARDVQEARGSACAAATTSSAPIGAATNGNGEPSAAVDPAALSPRLAEQVSAHDALKPKGNGADHDPPARLDPIAQAEASIGGATGGAPSAAPPPPSMWPEPLDLEALAEREPEAPKFIAANWLPIGYATLLAGHGGVGKSGIALHLAVCIAAGVPFFGLQVARRRVMYLSCEDRAAVLHWRLARICKFLGINLASLCGWFEVLDLVGQESVLWERDPRTGYTITPAYGCLSERMKRQATQVLFVDGISDTFGGNENARAEVKRFANALLGLVPADDGAVVLIGHVAKPTANAIATTEGYSGSTGWHNAVRARWYLYPETRGGDGQRAERTGDLILELQKSNLGPTNQSMRFVWDEAAHLFVGRQVVPSTLRDREARDEVDERAMLAALRGCENASPRIIVPAAATGPRTAFNVLSQRPEFPEALRADTKDNRARFRRLLERLSQTGRITEVEYRGPDSHKTRRLVPLGES